MILARAAWAGSEIQISIQTPARHCVGSETRQLLMHCRDTHSWCREEMWRRTQEKQQCELMMFWQSARLLFRDFWFLMIWWRNPSKEWYHLRFHFYLQTMNGSQIMLLWTFVAFKIFAMFMYPPMSQCSQRAETRLWFVWGSILMGPHEAYSLSFCQRDTGTLWPLMWWFFGLFWPSHMWWGCCPMISYVQ